MVVNNYFVLETDSEIRIYKCQDCQVSTCNGYSPEIRATVSHYVKTYQKGLPYQISEKDIADLFLDKPEEV